MKVQISFPTGLSTEDSIALDHLQQLVTDELNIAVYAIKSSPRPGVKDSGLTIGLAIASLTISAISTLVDVIKYWKSEHSGYNVTILTRDNHIGIDNLSRKDIDEISETASKAQNGARIEVLVSKR